MTGPQMLHDLPMSDLDTALEREEYAGTTPASRPWLAVHAAATAQACADALLSGLAGLGTRGGVVAWSPEWPEAMCLRSLGKVAVATADVEAALLAHRASAGAGEGMHVLCDDGHSVAVLVQSPDQPMRLLPGDARAGWMAAAGARFLELLQARRLQASVAQLARAEQLQHALFAIADMAGSDLDMPQMLQGLHRIVGGLMYAENFYIAMYERERDTLRFLYFCDTVDAVGPPDTELTMSVVQYGLTWYLIHDGRPLMGPTAGLGDQVSGPLRDIGTPSQDWLGVPMAKCAVRWWCKAMSRGPGTRPRSRRCCRSWRATS